jgi:Ala-tRNA(Pro) deacylase
MIPEKIVKYLREHRIPFNRHWHPRAVDAQRLAAALHISGNRVAKTVLCKADDAIWLAVLPASEIVDEDQLARVLGCENIRLMDESEFASMFPDCEVGAEPPFGKLYGLPVCVEESLVLEDRIIFRAGSHEETLELAYEDFAVLETPTVGRFGRPAGIYRGMRTQAVTTPQFQT